ncbi:hypothetical protein [Cellulosimicrobium protaetiae]|uniref:Helix-turn-helix domain-containing protein n=1 Tax=Cellulosimicrobium protaetiae TaxID=2587808 RepID=A0A6M5UMT3_9MICO|nr:hypothetical protein [Cellulosimicrobium protaetiae]QJW38673.1 hypothetical protein FIC82_020000 [Cellulosimicrobium protaetiae]
MSTEARCLDCGHTTRSATHRLALAGIARHSCERELARRAAVRDVLAREAARDRTPQPCLHEHAQHEHGTRACYAFDDCRCVPCTTANSEYEAQRTRDRAYGHPAFVDGHGAVRHARKLTSAGLGSRRIAELADVSRSTLAALLRGTRTATRQSIVDKLLAVPMPTVDDLAPGATTDATGTTRRVRALVAHGWSIAALADRTGIDRQVLDAAVNAIRPSVAVSTARAVRGAYDELWVAPVPESPGKTRALNRARSEGWPPPLAWDDDEIDDPAALPAPGWREDECLAPGCPETELLAHGLCSKHFYARRSASSPRTVDLDEFLHLVRSGEDLERAATRAGVQIRSIEERARSSQRADVLEAIRLARASVAV